MDYFNDAAVGAIGAVGSSNVNVLGTPGFGLGANGPTETVVGITLTNVETSSTKNVLPEYKYNESVYITEILEYINNTYGEHYSHNKFQATEFIIDSGHGTGFCMGNVMKYAQRYGKKGSPDDWRKDILKVIHYAIMQLHVHDKETK